MRQRTTVEDSCLNEAVGKERGWSNGVTPLTGVSLVYASGCLGKGQHECGPAHRASAEGDEKSCTMLLEDGVIYEGIMNRLKHDDEKQKEKRTYNSEQE